MSAEGNLYNPAVFTSSIPPTLTPTQSSPAYLDDGLYVSNTALALEYLEIVKSLQTRTATSAVKGHLFKIMRPALNVHKDMRERLGRAKGENILNEYESIIRDWADRMQVRLFHIADLLLAPYQKLKISCRRTFQTQKARP